MEMIKESTKMESNYTTINNIERKKDLLKQWPIRGMIMGIKKDTYDIEGRVYCSLEEKEKIVKAFVYWSDYRIKKI